MAGLNHRNLFLPVLEVWGQHDAKGCLPGLQMVTSLQVRVGREAGKMGESALSDVSSYQDSNPIVRAPPSWFYLNLISSQRSSCLNTITLELGLQHMNLKGWVGNTTQSIATLDQENIKQSQWGSAQCRNSGRYCRICLKVIHPKQ